MITCPQCHHQPSPAELEFYPEHCSQCGTLYSALEFINEKKRNENENLKAWRVTRWRPKYKSGLILSLPAVIVICYLMYFFGKMIIVKNIPKANRIHFQSEISSDLNGFVHNNHEPLESSLIITAQNSALLWLENQKTGKKIGPLQIENNQPKTILIEKGKYTVKTIQEEKIKIYEIVVSQKKETMQL